MGGHTKIVGELSRVRRGAERSGNEGSARGQRSNSVVRYDMVVVFATIAADCVGQV